MDQRLNMVMIGARHIDVLRSFYEQGLGWTNWGPASDMSVMYKTGTAVMVFLDADYLAKECGLPVAAGPKSIWAIFVDNKDQVDDLFVRAINAGAISTSPVRDRDGGLYSGYFTDPEGNGWEIVWSPHMPVGSDGAIMLGGGT